MGKIIWLNCATLIFALPSTAAAQEYKPGDEVVVIADGNLTVENRTVEKVFPGLVLKVAMVNGKWLWLSNGKPGWIDQRHVIPLDRAAIDRLTAMIRVKPSEGRLFSGRAFVWQELGEIDRAIGDFDEAIRLSPVAASYGNRGRAWHEKSEYDKAIADYDDALRLDPREAKTYNNRGDALAAKGEYDKAIVDYNDALRLDPKFANAHLNRGIAWEVKREYDKAIADYNEALRLDPKFADAFNNRGSARKAKGDYEKAIADFSEALRVDPKFESAYYNRGLASWAIGQYAKARSDFDDLLRLNPKGRYAAIYGHLAARQFGDEEWADHFLKAAGEFEEWPSPAVRFLRGEVDEPALMELAVDDDQRTEARCYLGLVHKTAGRKAEALADFQWVKEHGTKAFVEYEISLEELRQLEVAK